VTRNMRTHEIADVARAADVARLARENAGS